MPTRDDKGRFSSERASAEPTRVDAAVAASMPSSARGGRQTLDTSDQLGFNAPWVLLPPPNAQASWDIGQIDEIAFGRYSAERLVSLLIDLSPDASRGLWDYLRFMNPGSDILAVQLGTDKPYPQAQKAVDDFLQRLADLYGSPDLVWNRQATGMFLRGAIFTELVLDEEGRVPIDFGVPDPMTARFFRVPDPVRGTIWQLVQMQAGRLVELNRPTIRYVPIDPVPGSPYGRSPIAPALFSSIFLLLILHDLRRVVAQQGWPRHDISVDVQKLKDQMPRDKRDDPKALKQWTNDTIADVQKAYFALQPDQAFTHTEAITVNKPAGAMDNSSLGAIDPLIRGLERMVSRGIKSVPFLMGLSEPTSEATGIRQWESFSQSIKNHQRLLAHTNARLLQLGMQASGIQCDLNFAFEEARGSEAQRDEQVRALRIANAKNAYYLGYLSQEQASMLAVEQMPDMPEPRFVEVPEQVDPLGDAALKALGDQAAENPDKSTKSGKAHTRRANPTVRASDAGVLSDKEKEATVTAFDELFPGRFEGLLNAEVVK